MGVLRRMRNVSVSHRVSRINKSRIVERASQIRFPSRNIRGFISNYRIFQSIFRRLYQISYLYSSVAIFVGKDAWDFLEKASQIASTRQRSIPTISGRITLLMRYILLDTHIWNVTQVRPPVIVPPSVSTLITIMPWWLFTWLLEVTSSSKRAQIGVTVSR